MSLKADRYRRLIALIATAGFASLTACTPRDSQETATTDSISSPMMSPESGPGSDTTWVNTYAYGCDNDFQFLAHVGQDTTWLTLPDRNIRLPHTISASGARYSDGNGTYWSKGNDAVFEADGVSYANCAILPGEVPWLTAKFKGIDFRAVGNEPGWYTEIQAGKQILFVGDYGEVRITTDTPTIEQVNRSGVPPTTIYRATSGSRQITVTRVDTPCSDDMSGQSFSSTVTAAVDSVTYRGCGRVLR